MKSFAPNLIGSIKLARFHVFVWTSKFLDIILFDWRRHRLLHAFFFVFPCIPSLFSLNESLATHQKKKIQNMVSEMLLISLL